ncbi:pyridoxal phosphate-dependent transferase [Durotheca rogersii]|uniref:pyridoxal phosphate-dependent transferase n=1 Tax=Durotheca rogersii TaxID=419775 RepID=UPI0022206F32|nr:pyridoxal phosphate-dependent transferase [Durotheca rogersii]KAI5861512.1 pyridoxal phosphate-dependent transferase [Durotheca rogersii]
MAAPQNHRNQSQTMDTLDIQGAIDAYRYCEYAHRKYLEFDIPDLEAHIEVIIYALAKCLRNISGFEDREEVGFYITELGGFMGQAKAVLMLLQIWPVQEPTAHEPTVGQTALQWTAFRESTVWETLEEQMALVPPAINLDESHRPEPPSSPEPTITDRSPELSISDRERSMDQRSCGPPAFGQRMLQHFDFHPGYRNLNHGSFGASPRAVRQRLRHYQDLAEARPDQFIRYDAPDLLNECREALARFVHAPTPTVVLVQNATTGVNAVLRGIPWSDDGRDVILYFNTVYGACGKTVDYIVDSGRGHVSSHAIQVTYPCEDGEIVAALRAAVQDCAAAGKRARVCMFDTVSSLPGVRFPFEALVQACREAGVLSLVDGAQGVGMIEIDLAALDPDFFVSNCHKWLFVPRSCAVLYVPLRNQALVASSVPTSHGYVPKAGARFNPLPKSNPSAFVNNFQFLGTLDTSAYFCVRDALLWREQVLGGEGRIREYTQTLACEGGKKIAQILGTEVMENQSGTLSRCAMTNVALPLSLEEASEASEWMQERMGEDYGTFIPLFVHGGRPWARVSAQVYLDLDDFEWGGRVLLDLCERVKKGEHKNTQAVEVGP